jgi:hypothetical protein
VVRVVLLAVVVVRAVGKKVFGTEIGMTPPVTLAALQVP